MRFLKSQKLLLTLTLASIHTTLFAQSQMDDVPQIEVVGNQEGEQSIFTPNKILSGEELQNKMGASLGATLNNELGVSSSGFGAGASRPVIRGLDGDRVQILQNGSTVSDVSSISADHAVASPIQNARQIEILRGASALMYGSGSSGGLVNIVNDRIATSLPGEVTGVLSSSYESASQGKTLTGVVDSSIGQIALHADASVANANDYQIPGSSELGGSRANWAINPGVPVNTISSGRLPFSFNNQNNIGLGASYISDSGYTGVSIERLNHDYGIPSADGGFIQQSQNRYDLQHETRDPFDGFTSFKLSLSNSHYIHDEFDNNGVPQTVWKNDSSELRLQLSHQTWNNWQGVWGLQASTGQITALDVPTGASAILPQTTTNSEALFWVEEGVFGDFKTNLGLRYNLVDQKPNQGSSFAGVGSEDFVGGSFQTPNLQDRQFNLVSYSVGEMWSFQPGYGLGASYTLMQRAPSATELYAYGPHDSTSTFIIGNSNLATETSHNLEFSLQKTYGLIQGKANVYFNQFSNYIYGFNTGAYSASNNNYSVVVSQQADALIKGAEAELTYNWKKSGLGTRVFGDVSQGTFAAGGNLPLQPAPRVGAELAYELKHWTANLTLIHAFEQTRLADFEIGPTPSYNLVNTGISYSEKMNQVNWTGYLRITNLLDQDIRYATTPETVRLYAPQMGRSILMGIKAAF